jgi:uncharacterized membrane protein
MPTVEQSSLIQAPIHLVMEVLNDVKNIPNWATVSGTVTNVRGNGPGMAYEWHYKFNNLTFDGYSEVLEQTNTTLITRTTGDVDSIWTITLTDIGASGTAMNVVVEYTPPNTFIELLTDFLLEQLGDPAVAQENMLRFKALVETRAKLAEKQVVARA